MHRAEGHGLDRSDARPESRHYAPISTSGGGATTSAADVGLAACDGNALGSQGWLVVEF